MTMLVNVAIIIAAYLLGSVATAVITCRLMGLPDPRSLGSGNPGATNVLRHGGGKAAAITLLGDVLKGFLPVGAAALLALPPAVVAGAALAAFLGHLFPVYFGFRGGKGVATAFGAMLGMSWMLASAVAATWLVTAIAFRYSSLSALTAAALAPVYAVVLEPAPAYVGVMLVMSVLLFWRHRSNIRKLLDGTEDKIGEKPA